MTVMKRETREQARQLRAQGISIIQIAKQLGVSRGSVSAWVRDVPLTDEQMHQLAKNKGMSNGQRIGSSVNRDKALAQRKIWQDVGRAKAREGRDLHKTGCLLYWAEGAKGRNQVIFVNSDPEMMKLFIRFLREELNVAEKDFIVIIHCHSHEPDDWERITNYWLGILGLTQQNMRNLNVKKGSDTRKNRLDNGICTLRVYSTELAMHIYGAIQEYGGFNRPEWLF
ncbi:MAG: helix-turn-helix domain-containing protein [Anaerolineae bacterium]|nr:helix-turn-helix domain-containing protein [Anaerolineae bacterium]